jgi:hypothetical protein
MLKASMRKAEVFKQIGAKLLLSSKSNAKKSASPSGILEL